ncbi:MAG: DUF4886 domain-containing protein [Clostridia bacterium]|nr:DUF4886 domain-containing protein [Clostridia bacterium]
MNILAIGNSFSQDATRYLHQVGHSAGDYLRVVNLYIGGCSLERHYNNMIHDERAYSLEYNGESTGFNVSINEALCARTWDIISLQQVSHKSPRYETYQPYLNALAAYCRQKCPTAKIVMHMTWAYEQDSKKLCEEMKYTDQYEMFSGLKSAYISAASEIGAAGIIPSGMTFQNLYNAKIGKFHRDTFHADLGFGRLALAYTWYEALTGKSCLDIPFDELDTETSKELIAAAKKAAHDAVAQNAAEGHGLTF